LVLNPRGQHYDALKAYLNTHYEDCYFDQDAIFMERNSRDFQRRIRLIDQNTETICDFLRSQSLAGGASPNDSSIVIKDVLYPKYVTRENYETYRIKSEHEGDPGGGFGGLFSITFVSSTASVAFFDTLPCYKGPSLGTNFTLACPFVILAHYLELEWAASYGVEGDLVRVSVGMEDVESLLDFFKQALDAAKAAVATANGSSPSS
jgi:cystathionine gamma-synthase